MNSFVDVFEKLNTFELKVLITHIVDIVDEFVQRVELLSGNAT